MVVENIERWMAKGLPPREATIKAMDEITGPVIAITLVLSSVFIPTAFLAGITGQFYRQFALTIAASTIISAINAMTMAPARAVTLIKPHVARPGEPARGPAALGHRGADRLSRLRVIGGPWCWRCCGLSRPAATGTKARRRPTPPVRLLSLWSVRLVIFAAGSGIGLVRRPAGQRGPEPASWPASTGSSTDSPAATDSWSAACSACRSSCWWSMAGCWP